MEARTQEQQAWIDRRDEILLRGDVREVIELIKELWGKAPTKAMAEVAMHEAITAALSLPMEYRSKSKKWLHDRGFKSLDDGDVPLP